MMYKELMQTIKKYNEIVIFGFGRYGKELYRFVTKNDFAGCLLMCDNAKDRQGQQEIDGKVINVLSTDEATKKHSNALFLISVVNENDRDAIVGQLHELLGAECLNIEKNAGFIIRDMLMGNAEEFYANNRKRLKNREFTIISNYCFGGIILHSLKQPFDTPTINLYIEHSDFIKFAKNFEYYINQDVIETEDLSVDWPVGLLGDIKIFFMHYDTFEEALDKWNERKKRIHYDNIYFIMSDRNVCTDDMAKEFDELPYKHKAFLTSKERTHIKSSVQLSECFELAYKTDLSGLRVVDEWDYVSFLNDCDKD